MDKRDTYIIANDPQGRNKSDSFLSQPREPTCYHYCYTNIVYSMLPSVSKCQAIVSCRKVLDTIIWQWEFVTKYSIRQDVWATTVSSTYSHIGPSSLTETCLLDIHIWTAFFKDNTISNLHIGTQHEYNVVVQCNLDGNLPVHREISETIKFSNFMCVCVVVWWWGGGGWFQVIEIQVPKMFKLESKFSMRRCNFGWGRGFWGIGSWRPNIFPSFTQMLDPV